MKKKRFVGVIAAVCALVIGLTACGNSAGTSGWSVVKQFTYKDISSWQSMATPTEGSGAGTVSATDDESGFVTIQAASDGWGGLESDYIELDLSKDPIIMAKVFECPDGSKWGIKVVPENAIEDHQWGLYVVPDNTMKWNCYGGANLNEALGEDFAAIYGEQCKVKLWIYAAGGPESTVSVSDITIVNTK